MPTAEAAPRSGLAACIGFFVLYVAAAALSASTAFVQANAAAVWVPSGFAAGLLIARGTRLWPVVASGSLAFNLALNLSVAPAPSTISLIVAVAIATGNTAEAVLAAFLARRFAAIDRFMWQTRAAAAFALVVAPLPPLVSTLIGVTASRYGGLKADGSLVDVALTWYIGNYIGIMVFTGLTILALEGRIRLPDAGRIAETLALTLCLCLVGQAICGFSLSGWLGNWLQCYMAIPLVLWACFRFEVAGAPLAIALIALIAVIGTLRGYAAFPSKSPWEALIYLQVFIGMLSVIWLAVSSSVAELKASRATLEERVVFRTREIEALMRERETFTVLVAHDLQSPLYGVRNALRTTGAAVTGNALSGADLGSALAIMEQTCSTLADRVTSLLRTGRNELVVAGAGRSRSVAAILQRIASAHGLDGEEDDAVLVPRGDLALSVSRPDDVEHIVDTLIDNALKYAGRASPVDVAVSGFGDRIEIAVSDAGPGLDPATRRTLLRLPAPERAGRDANAGSGLGLYLANEKALELGGRLGFTPNRPRGCTFKLVLPV